MDGHPLTDEPVPAGMLSLLLPDGQAVLWFRGEAERTVDWGGDPHNKAIAVREGDQVRREQAVAPAGPAGRHGSTGGRPSAASGPGW